MKEYIVICSSHEDRTISDRLRSDLKAAGISIWIDAGIMKGDSRYAVSVADGIKNATNFLFLASRNSIKSPTMKMELAAASRADVPVTLISLDNAGYHAASKSSSSVTKIDMRNDYQTAVDEIVNMLVGPKSSEPEIGFDPSVSKGYIFLSYATPDTPYVNEVKEFLIGKGYAYWEFQDSTRDYHGNLNVELEDVIRNASATLSILSPSWKKSGWALKEFSFSEEIGTPVFLLRFREMGPTLAISGRPYIDFVESRQKGFSDLEKELVRLDIMMAHVPPKAESPRQRFRQV